MLSLKILLPILSLLFCNNPSLLITSSVESVSENPFLKAPRKKQLPARRYGMWVSHHNGHFKSLGQINTLIQNTIKMGLNTLMPVVWRNGCPLFNSQTFLKQVGYQNCPEDIYPNWFSDLLNAAHKANISVEPWFELGFKMDRDSPLYPIAKSNNWLLSSDPIRNYYYLDVSIPAVKSLILGMQNDFSTLYPTIASIQWDDHLGIPKEFQKSSLGSMTQYLNNFVTELVNTSKKTQTLLFMAHHPLSWAKSEYQANWSAWPQDGAYIEAYVAKNFTADLQESKTSAKGVGIAMGLDTVNTLDDAYSQIQLVKTSTSLDLFLFSYLQINTKQEVINKISTLMK